MFETYLHEDPKIRAQEIDYIQRKLHSPFTQAVTKNEFKKVEVMLKTLTEEELNWQCLGFGNTALHWAVANTNSRMALMLLKNTPRIKVNLLDSRKKTALHLAVAKGWDHFTDNSLNDNELPQSSIIKELAKKADLNIQDENGNTPLHIAVMRRDIDCIKLLLSSGALEDIQNHQGQTPCDMLRMEFQQVEDFIQKYAAIFTLYPTQWSKNKNKILRLFNDKKERPAEYFNQAISDLTNWLAHDVTNSANSPVHQSVQHFLFQIKSLKANVVDLFLHDNIEFDDARKLASESLKLSQKIVGSTIAEADVIAFHKATAAYRKTPTLNKIIGAIIGAALGICIGLLAGPITGLLGSTLGVIGFWGTKKYQEQQHPLQQLESAATIHIRECRLG